MYESPQLLAPSVQPSERYAIVRHRHKISHSANENQGERFDGDAMPDLSCPACQRILRPNPNCGSETIVCGACHAIVWLKSGHAQLGGRQPDSVETLLGVPPMKLGDTGILRGKHLTVIGILKRADGEYAWYECALADPAGEVTWLWVDRGHFSVCVAESRDCVTRDSLRHYT